MRLNLQNKFILLTTPLIVFPLLLLGWFSYTQLKQTTEERTLRQMTTLLYQVGLQVRDRQRTTQANAVLFSNSILVQKYLITGEEDRYSLMQPTLLRQFNSYLDAYPEYQDIQIILPDGYVDTSISSGSLGHDVMDVGNRDFFQAMAAHESADYAGYHMDPAGDHFVLLASRRIETIDRAFDPIVSRPELRGYLAITMGLDFLQGQIERNRVGRQGFLLVTDAQGGVVFKPALVGSLAAIEPRYISAGSSDPDDLPSQSIRMDGIDYLLQAYSLGDNLKLLALLPRGELLASSRELGIVVAAITLFSILVTMSLLFMVVRRQLISPIHVLTRAAREIGRGNLAVPIHRQSRDELGELFSVFSDMRDHLQSSHEQVSYLAYHDSITGLPNRLMFREYLQDVLRDAERSGHDMALLFLDLDNFKRVNDTLGHQAGDELLQEISGRLSACVRGGDFVAQPSQDSAPELVARLGGDEFIVLLPGIDNPQVPALVARRILDALAIPVVIQGQEVHVSGSIGITLFPQDGRDAAALVKHADIAMYHAKSMGRNNYQFYSEEINGNIARQLDLENRLRRAIKNDELVLHYQPVLDTDTLKVVGAEALVRWRDEEYGLVYPDAFIPLAEETGLIVPLGEWVLREACRQCAQWHQDGLGPLRISVNLSAMQTQKGDIVATVDAVLRETGLPANSLELELTETCLLNIGEQAVATLNGLSQLGVLLALDDFGTGYSSLAHLKRFCVDRLKIDRSFVRDLDVDEDDAAICAAIIAMSHKLGIAVTAEGVEEESQLARLVSWSCDQVQGYLLCKPQPNAGFEAFARGQKPVLKATTG
jgi:diguanylate cyclase (GGDEF)-like protein